MFSMIFVFFLYLVEIRNVWYCLKLLSLKTENHLFYESNALKCTITINSLPKSKEIFSKVGHINTDESYMFSVKISIFYDN